MESGRAGKAGGSSEAGPGSLRARCLWPSHGRTSPLCAGPKAGRQIRWGIALGLVLVAVLVPALMGERGVAHAQIAEGEAVSVPSALCASCHGADGRSTHPGVPSLAGQPIEFLEAQLRRFRDGERISDAMQPVARGLSDSQLHALAEHYARLPARGAEDGGDTALLAKGRAIARNRMCGSCHRRDFHGSGLVPRLAGQREEYLRASLIAYREQRRASPERVMVAAADRLPDEHIEALAHYLAHCR